MSRIEFKIEGNITPLDYCVFRINAGSKYFIWKAKTLDVSLKSMTSDLTRKLLPGKLPANDLFFDFVNYIKRYRIYNLTVVVLLETKDVNELVSFEETLLKQTELDPDCLNSSSVPYHPKWITELLGNVVIQKISFPVKEKPDAVKTMSKPEKIPSKNIIVTEKVSAPPFVKKPSIPSEIEKKQDVSSSIEDTKLVMPSGPLDLDRIKQVLRRK